MVSLFPRRLRDKFWPEALPPPESFKNQTVLVTGATGGLGLGAAIHFLNFGARVILTSRTISKGTMAKEFVEKCTGIVGHLDVLELDRSRYSSCLSFVTRLEHLRNSDPIDVAILNAGLINVDYEHSPEGWEQTLQVHTLSTTLLGLLLLDWMRQKKSTNLVAPHLVFVTSRKHLLPKITTWDGMSARKGILQYFSDPDNWALGQIDPNYSETKLMLTYAVEHISKRAMSPDGDVEVIVNTVCSGLKAVLDDRLFTPVYFSLLGKSTDYGARSLVIAAATLEKDHGKCIQLIYTEEEYSGLSIPNLKSEKALKIKELVWREIITELKLKVPALKVI